MEPNTSDTSPLERYFMIREEPEAANLSCNYRRLDVIAPLQMSLSKTTFVVCMVFFSALGFYADGADIQPLLGVISAITAILLLLNLTLECTYVLDTKTQTILYYRRICGLARTWKICSYEDVQRVGMKLSKQYSKYQGAYTAHHVVLELKSGKAFIISRPARFFAEADELAQAMADTFQAEYIPANNGETTIEASDDDLLNNQTDSISLPAVKWTVDTYIVFVLFLFTVAVSIAAFTGVL